MSWTMRVSTAIAVAVAFAAAPLALDLCAASCEATHGISMSASAPPCHHASAPSGPRIGHSPIPCGHDHNATFTTATTDATPVAQTLNAATTMNGGGLTVMTIVHPMTASFASPPHDPFSRHPSAALRV